MNNFKIIVSDDMLEEFSYFSGHTDRVKGACLLSNDRMLTWSDDRTLRIWNPKAEYQYDVYGDTEQMFNFDYSEVFILSDNRISVKTFASLRLFDERGVFLNELDSYNDDSFDDGSEYNCDYGDMCGFLELHDGRFVGWRNDFGERFFWDHDWNKLDVLSGYGPIIGTLYLPDKNMIFCDGNNISLYNKYFENIGLMSGVGTMFLLNKNQKIIPIECLINNRNSYFARLGDDHVVEVENIHKKEYILLRGHTDEVKGIIMLSESLILSWSSDKTFRVWDREGKLIQILKIHEGEIDGVLPLQHNRILSWSEHELIIWGVDSTLKKELFGHSGSIKGAIALPGNRIVTWAKENILILWDDEGSLLRKLDGHTDEVNGAYLLPGDHILSWTKSNMRIWTREGDCLWESGQPITNLPYKVNRYFQDKKKTVSNITLNEESSTVLLKVPGEEHCLNLRWNGTAECRAEHLFKDGRAVITSKNENIIVLQAYVGNQPVMFD